MATLLDNVSVDTNSEALPFTKSKKTLYVNADDFGGGTVNIQVKQIHDSEDRWLTIENGSFTEAAHKLIDITSGNYEYRAQLIGSSGASNVFVSVD